MRVAAVQLETVIGDIDANLAACERLAGAAAGEGVAVADVVAARIDAGGPEPKGFWIQELDPLSKAGWHLQGWHGRRWYRRHAARTPAANSSNGSAGRRMSTKDEREGF